MASAQKIANVAHAIVFIGNGFGSCSFCCVTDASPFQLGNQLLRLTKWLFVLYNPFAQAKLLFAVTQLVIPLKLNKFPGSLE